MEKNYYITSANHSIRERQIKRGKVYDVFFRIITLDGIEKQKKLSGFASKTLAKQGYLDFVKENCETLKNSDFKKKSRKIDYTVRELSLIYFSSLKNQIKETSIYEKQKMFEWTIMPKFANVPISKLTKEVLIQWQDDLWCTKKPKTNDYYSYKYLSNIRINFSAFLNWCAERYNTPNHLKDIKKPKKRLPKTEMQIWDKETFDRFISVVDKPMYRCMFMMMFYTGRRKGEILALSPKDIKKDKIVFNKTYSRKVFDVPYLITSTKNEKSGETPICPALQEELKKYTCDDGAKFFFGGENPVHENSVGNHFKKYCQLANVPAIRLHDLRHSFVSRLIHLGANLFLVAELIGDSVEQVLKTYGHVYNTDKLDIISKI